MFRIARNQGQVGARGLIRLGASLLPIPQSSEWNVEARRKLLLSEVQSAPNEFGPRRPLHTSYVARIERLRIAIRARGLFDHFRAHRPKRFV